MTPPSVPNLLSAVAAYGYPLLFAASVAEATFLIGLVVPGDLAVMLGGASAARGVLDVRLLYLLVALGGVAGSQLSYSIGLRGGKPLLLRWGARFDVHHQRIEAVEGFFQRHGAKAVFLATLASGMKNVLPAVAGAIAMDRARFTLWNTLGCVVRSAILVGIGYVLGAHLDQALAIVGSANGAAVVAFAAVVVLFVVQRRRRRRV